MTATDLDGPGLFAQLSAKIGASVDLGEQQLAETKRMRDAMDAMTMQQPVNWRAQGSAIADAAGVAMIQFSPGGPDLGHVWVVYSIIVGGDTWDTSAAGAAELYVSAMDFRTLADTAPPLTDLLDQATSLPLPSFYSNNQVTLRAGEQLYMRIVGGTEGQQYSAAARGIDYQEGVRKQASVI